MKKEFFAFSAIAALTAFAPLTLADQVNFSFNGGGISSSGTFIISDTSTPGYEAITAISGTFTDTNAGISGAITGLHTPISYTAPPAGPPASTAAGISYDDMFYPGADSPHNCSDYPFFGGVFDVYGVAFDVAGGYVGEIWSDGVIPGAGLIYAAGDSNGTTLLDLPNPDGADQTRPVGVPGGLVTSTAAPEPSSVFLFSIGMLGVPVLLIRKRKQTAA